MRNPLQAKSGNDLPLMRPGPGKNIVPDNDYIPFPDEAILGSIPDRFEEQVDLYPRSVAVKSRGQTYTYIDVNRSANRLARTILETRGQVSEPVLLSVDHGASAIIAILGILKTGKFYVPIDPVLPLEKSSYVLHDSQARLVVTNSTLLPAAQGFVPHTIQILNVDDVDDGQDNKNLDLPIKPDTPAAIMYTSGSSGQPKGVISTHGNVLHAIKVGTNYRHVRRDDRLALLSSCSTGTSRAEIFGALLNGAAVLPFDVTFFHPQEEGLNNLAGWLMRERITLLSMVPTLFRHFIETLTGEESFPDLRLITLGGETTYRQDLEQFRRHFSDDCLLRLSMGMTEACRAVTSVMVKKATRIEGDIMPVGYPHKDTDILLLDEDGKDIGQDRIGEIAVKSTYLSPGYWRRPDLTSQSFLDCPGEEGTRIYRTGDLGILTSDGCLFHLGRKDFQVKVRGHRVETEEVERILYDIEGISHAAVAVHPNTRRENRLVAYIECDHAERPTIAGLRALLKYALPDYMIPSHFVFLDKLPLTSSGKIDRQALPAPDMSRPELDTPFIAPGTPTEKRLANIWSNILHVSPVGINDDFFDLGGHSLSAARTFVHINQVFGTLLPVSVLFQAPTIEKLAAVVDTRGSMDNSSGLIQIRKGGRKHPLFFIHTLTGDVIAYAELARHLDPEQPFYGIKAQGLDGTSKPRTRIESMASQYIEEIRRVQPEGPYLLGGMCFGGVVAFEIARQLHSEDHRIDLLVLLDSPCPPLHWKQAVLFRLSRLAWHAKEDIRGLLGPASDRSPLLKHRSLARRLLSFHTMIRILRVDRANLLALKRYLPGHYSGEIVHFLRSHPVARRDQDIRMQWDRYAEGGIDLHTIPGNHHTMLREPNVRILAEKLNEYLHRIQS